MKNLKNLSFALGFCCFGILVSCENSTHDIVPPATQEPIDFSKDSLYISNTNPFTFEPINFRFTVNTNGKEIRDVYDSLTFAVSDIDKELKFFSIGYEAPNDPIGNPVEFGPSIWKHHFFKSGVHTVYIYAYKNGIKKTLKSADINVIKNLDLFNIGWNDFKDEQIALVNQVEIYRTDISKGHEKVSLISNIKTISATHNWLTTRWPYDGELYDRGNEIFVEYLEDTYGTATYLASETNNIVDVFNNTFKTIRLRNPHSNSIYGIWITEKSKIVILIQSYSDSQHEYFIYAEENN